MILDPDELPVRAHYKACGQQIPPCFMCGKQIERGVLWRAWGGTLTLHAECARYLIEQLQRDLRRMRCVPEILIQLFEGRVP